MKTNPDQLTPLTHQELMETDGGNPALFLAGAALGIACIYYAGYAIGKWLCECDQ